jgi:hypothetical protein
VRGRVSGNGGGGLEEGRPEGDGGGGGGQRKAGWQGGEAAFAPPAMGVGGR